MNEEDKLIKEIEKVNAAIEKANKVTTGLHYKVDLLNTRSKRMKQSKEIIPYYSQLLARLTNANVFVRSDVLKTQVQELADGDMSTNSRIDSIAKRVLEFDNRILELENKSFIDKIKDRFKRR